MNRRQEVMVIDQLLDSIAANAAEIIGDLPPLGVDRLVRAITQLYEQEPHAQTNAQLEEPVHAIFQLIYDNSDLHWLIPDPGARGASRDDMSDGEISPGSAQRIPQLGNTLLRCREQLAEALNPKQQSEPDKKGRQS